jgi:hypothetical protein
MQQHSNGLTPNRVSDEMHGLLLGPLFVLSSPQVLAAIAAIVAAIVVVVRGRLLPVVGKDRVAATMIEALRVLSPEPRESG